MILLEVIFEMVDVVEVVEVVVSFVECLLRIICQFKRNTHISKPIDKPIGESP
jgi:hypothetical protein